MEPFKNMFNLAAAQNIAKAINEASPKFSQKLFLHNLERELSPLELKDRMLLLKTRLSEQIDPSPKSFPTLVASLKKSQDSTKGLSGFQVWPLTQFVAEFGLKDFDRSLKALKEMTKVFTAEFAVRPFFLKDQERMLETFLDWSLDPNEHVRRLVSEGSRPLLPWGLKLPSFLEDPSLTWPLIEALKNDSSKYVQKSVANHMNDLSKKNGEWLVKQLKNWPNPWVTRHALRTLIKQGHPGALKLIGVGSQKPKIISSRLLTPQLKLGETLELQIKLENPLNRSMKIIVDLELSLLKARGHYSNKVFKGKSLTLSPKESQALTLRTPLRKVTTRTYHTGTQYVSIVVNGLKLTKKPFKLKL